MKRLLLVGMLVLLLGNLNPAVALINGGFETGNFTGWTLNEASLGSVVTTHTGDYSNNEDQGGSDLTYSPVEGSYFAELSAGINVGVYTVLSQGISLKAGDTLSGYAAFDYRDYWGFDDSAFVKVLDAAGNMVATPWFEHGEAPHPDYWDGPWTPWSWTASAAGTYFLEFGVANLGDNALSSYALFDANVAGSNPVPEPATMILLGFGMAGIAAFRRKLKES